MSLKNYLYEASFMIARQLKVVSQINVFMISGTRNIQYVLKKFVKGILDIYLNNIDNVIFSLHLVGKCLGEHCLYALPSNKRSQNSINV